MAQPRFPLRGIINETSSESNDRKDVSQKMETVFFSQTDHEGYCVMGIWSQDFAGHQPALCADDQDWSRDAESFGNRSVPQDSQVQTHISYEGSVAFCLFVAQFIKVGEIDQLLDSECFKRGGMERTKGWRTEGWGRDGKWQSWEWL